MPRRLARARCAAGLLFLMSTLFHGRAVATDLGPLLKAFFEATDLPSRQSAIAAIRAAAPDPLDVEQGLRQGRSYPADTKKGWQVFTHTGSDGKARPYHVFVPKGYDPARKHPAIVSLHGGVNRTNLLPEALVREVNAGIQEVADKYGWLVIVPLGQRGATWYDEVGMANVLAQLAAVKRRYNVDEARVFLMGHSDGGNGAFIMGLYRPTPWAGFVAWAGSVIGAVLAPNKRSPPTSQTGRSRPRTGESIRFSRRFCRRCSSTSSRSRASG